MTIGTGIFLSAVVIAAAIIITRIRNSWNWKKIGLWALVLLVGLPALIVGGLSAYDVWAKRPRVQYGFWGVKIGDSPADVKFKKGPPSKFSGPGAKTYENKWAYSLKEDGSTVSEVKIGDTTSALYLIEFSPSHKVKSIIEVYGEIPTFYELGFIGPTSSLDDVESKLGQPSFVSRLSDDTERWYSFDAYHVAFAFSRGRMTEVAVYDPVEGPVRFATEAK